MPKVLIGGVPTDVTLDQIFQDDGTTPFTPPAPVTPPEQTFSAADVERIRQEEKDKVYSRLTEANQKLATLEEQVGQLNAAEEQRLEAARVEQEAAAAEARRVEEEGLSAKDLVARTRQEFDETVHNLEQTWSEKLGQEQAKREQAEAIAAREREFNDLREYTQAQVTEHQEEIAPELFQWITGNTKEEIDAAIARAVETTSNIAAQFQEALGQQTPGSQQQQQQVVLTPQPPALPGTRVTGGPGNIDPAGDQSQQLTAEQIANMPMGEWAKVRRQIGIGGQSNSRGLFG